LQFYTKNCEKEVSYTKDEIAQYYKECNNAYRDAWGMDKNFQLNLGLWKKDTKKLSDALFNLNEEIAVNANLNDTMHVLDAGCGVGGTAIHFAKHYRCRVTGITLSNLQLQTAKENVLKLKLDDRIDFHLMNYMNTSFKDESFDVIVGIESICYAQPKYDFLIEAYRLLKKGGRLILAENLQAKKLLNADEYRSLYTNAFNGCKVELLDTEANYRKNLKSIGYAEINCIDKTKEIRPSIKRLRRFYYPAFLYNAYHRLIGRPFSKTQEANTKMCYHLLSSLDRGLWKYSIIKATKPNE